MPTHLIWDNIFSNEPWIFMWSLIWYRGILQKMVVFLKLSELGILLWNCFKLYYFFLQFPFFWSLLPVQSRCKLPIIFFLTEFFNFHPVDWPQRHDWTKFLILLLHELAAVLRRPCCPSLKNLWPSPFDAKQKWTIT